MRYVLPGTTYPGASGRFGLLRALLQSREAAQIQPQAEKFPQRPAASRDTVIWGCLGRLRHYVLPRACQRHLKRQKGAKIEKVRHELLTIMASFGSQMFPMAQAFKLHVLTRFKELTRPSLSIRMNTSVVPQTILRRGRFGSFSSLLLKTKKILPDLNPYQASLAHWKNIRYSDGHRSVVTYISQQ